MANTIKVNVSSINRMKELFEEFKCDDILIPTSPSGYPLLGGFFKEVKKRISEAEVTTWKEEMIQKPTLEIYRSGESKPHVGSDIYDNSRGSSLLALARAGILPTRARLHRFDDNFDPICTRCGMEEETMEHVVFECNDIYASPEDLLKKLGLSDSENFKEGIKELKLILTQWEQDTRNKPDPPNGP